VLNVVIGSIAAAIARIAAGKQALEIVKRKPQLVERGTRKRLGKKRANSIAHRGRVTHLHGIGNVVIVTAIL
jgi:hypothetical protein